MSSNGTARSTSASSSSSPSGTTGTSGSRASAPGKPLREPPRAPPEARSRVLSLSSRPFSQSASLSSARTASSSIVPPPSHRIGPLENVRGGEYVSE